MEQHPVPQNVTTFQFRLIGDMTIKQFGYLAGGAILAFIAYKLPVPFFFSWPLALIFGLGGFGFAFVPVEERPMDIWVLSFIKNIYSPTQYVWQKEVAPSAPASPQSKPAPAPQVAPHPVVPAPTHQSALPSQKQDVLRRVFTPTASGALPTQNSSLPLPKMVMGVPMSPPQQTNTQPPTARVVTVNKKAGLFDWIGQLFAPVKAPAPAASPLIDFSRTTPRKLDISAPPIVTIQKTQQTIVDTQNRERELDAKMQSLKKELESRATNETHVLELQKQLTEALSQRENMEAELMRLRKQIASSAMPTAQTTTPTVTHAAQPAAAPPMPTPVDSHSVTAPSQKQTTVKIITPETAVKAGLPRLTTFPNVVTGIIKDSENNFLPGVLVTVKDKDTMPLRALKTNRLGQFAASTPLANGVYFVEIEDPRHRFRFDRVQITLNGSIVPALEIIAKSEKEINRAILEKELFGSRLS